MTSWIGKSIAHYKVSAQIGAGGMGEVYRASDSRLGRDVAIKVLPAEFAQDTQRMARFEREARLLASLSHNNIASIYGIEEIDGTRALVMELVEGPTLAERIAKGALPLDEALAIAKQIADALEYAHERTIIHRDLKPANIKLSTDGTVKVLDFGLAKALSDDPAGSGSDLSKSPTLTAASTRLGVILGTAAYMSPEQAKGKTVDRRADIWAFGTVLMEMLTGKQTFAGETVSETLASVMKDEPEWDALTASTSAPVRELLRRCLLKDPKQRLRDIGEARVQIEDVISGRAPAHGAPPSAAGQVRRGIPALPVVLIALGAIALGIAGGYRMRAPQAPPLIQAQIGLPEGMALGTRNVDMVFSPDGNTLAMVASAPEGPMRIWLRRLDRPVTTPLEGTDGATYPFWSPDGKNLGFFADRKLKRIAADGGVVQAICDAVDGRGASWGSDGTIVFAPGPLDGLQRVPASGGVPEFITTLDSTGISHRLPQFLPDRKRVLFISGGPSSNVANVECVDITTKKRSLLFKSESQVRLIDDTHVAYVTEKNLVIQGFDPGSLQLKGRPIPVAQGIRVNPYRFAAAFDIAASGNLVWTAQSNAELVQLTWFDLDGHRLGELGDPGTYMSMAFSPDGRRLAYSEDTGNIAMWMMDVATGVRTRFTFGEEPAFDATWSRDAKTLYYGNSAGQVWAQATDGASPPKRVIDIPATSLTPYTMVPGQNALVCIIQRAGTGMDLCAIDLDGESKIRDLVVGPGNQNFPDFSPDGHWLAYHTLETGRPEVIVVPWPSLDGRWQLSSQGGAFPVWSPDGRSIVYETPEHRLMRVAVDGRGQGLVIGATTTLFGGKPVPEDWWLAPDGKRLLRAMPVGASGTVVINLVTDWRQLLDGGN